MGKKPKNNDLYHTQNNFYGDVHTRDLIIDSSQSAKDEHKNGKKDKTISEKNTRIKYYTGIIVLIGAILPIFLLVYKQCSDPISAVTHKTDNTSVQYDPLQPIEEINITGHPDPAPDPKENRLKITFDGDEMSPNEKEIFAAGIRAAVDKYKVPLIIYNGTDDVTDGYTLIITVIKKPSAWNLSYVHGVVSIKLNQRLSTLKQSNQYEVGAMTSMNRFIQNAVAQIQDDNVFFHSITEIVN